MSARWGKADSKPKLLGWPLLTDAVEKVSEKDLWN